MSHGPNEAGSVTSGADRPPPRSKRGKSKKKQKKKSQRKQKPSWWRRVSAGVLAAGALAAAITAIVGLWPDPDPVDRVTISSAESTPQPLSTYVATLTIRPVGGGRGGGGKLLYPHGALSDLLADSTTTPSRTTGSSQTSGTSTGTATRSTTGATSTGSTSGSTSQVTTTSASTSGSAYPELAPSVVLRVPVDIRERIYGDLRRAAVLDQFALPDRITTLPEAIPFTIQEAVGEEGDALPPEEAARNLAARLEQVRSVLTDRGRDPLGVRVTVDLEMEGLRGENLLLYWRLVPAGTTQVPDEFAQATPAFRLTPGSELDSATLDVWVPLPEAPGPYAVDLLVMHEAGSAPLESFRSDPFD